MRKFFPVILSFIFCFLAYSSLLTVKAAAVGVLKFDSASYTIQPNNTFQVQVIVDPGTDQISGTDAYVLYDPTLLSVDATDPNAVAAGSYFPSVSHSITSGKVSIWGVVDTPAQPKSGIGTIATITFKALKDGSGTLQYFCDLSVNNTSKIVKNDINATNIIDCSQNGSSIVTVGNADTPTPGGIGGGLSPTPIGGVNPTLVPTASPSGILVASASPTLAVTLTLTPTTPQALPTSGVVGAIMPIALPGAILLIMGGLIRVIL